LEGVEDKEFGMSKSG